jgi:hypothetical protein
MSPADTLSESISGPASSSLEAVGRLVMLASSLQVLPCSLHATYYKSNDLFPMLL